MMLGHRSSQPVLSTLRSRTATEDGRSSLTAEGGRKRRTRRQWTRCSRPGLHPVPVQHCGTARHEICLRGEVAGDPEAIHRVSCPGQRCAQPYPGQSLFMVPWRGPNLKDLWVFCSYTSGGGVKAPSTCQDIFSHKMQANHLRACPLVKVAADSVAHLLAQILQALGFYRKWIHRGRREFALRRFLK